MYYLHGTLGSSVCPAPEGFTVAVTVVDFINAAISIQFLSSLSLSVLRFDPYIQLRTSAVEQQQVNAILCEALYMYMVHDYDVY